MMANAAVPVVLAGRESWLMVPALVTVKPCEEVVVSNSSPNPVTVVPLTMLPLNCVIAGDRENVVAIAAVS
jgi:hypothetical protein